ncbi:MAG: hypothetical protein ISQ13_04850 [Candidatus Margulisbacteria bacterium]|nr:hypothetical protein [Candidatus Margulisiibacteriota bacterium]
MKSEDLLETIGKEISFNEESPPIGDKMVLQLLHDVSGEGANRFDTFGMSCIANKILADLVVDNPKLKDALNASTTVEEAIVDIDDKDSFETFKNAFKNAFNDHFETHEVLTCSNLGTINHNVAVNVRKNKGDKYEFVLCNRGRGSKDINGNNRTYYSVEVTGKDMARKLMTDLIEFQHDGNIEKVYEAFDNAGNARIKTDIPTPPSQRMGNCGLASKLAAIKALCFEEDSTQGGTVNGESSPTYRDFRDALKAAAESYIHTHKGKEELQRALNEQTKFKTVTRDLKEKLGRLGQPPTSKGKAIFDAFTTAIDEVKDHANAVSELNRLSDLLDNEVKKLKKDLLTETEGMGKLKLKSDIRQCLKLYNLLLDLSKADSTDSTDTEQNYEQKLSDFYKKELLDLKTNTEAIDTVYTQLNAILVEGVNPTTGEGVPELMTKFKQALMTINGSMDEETFNKLSPMIEETSTRIFTALGGKIEGAWELSGNAKGLQLLVVEIHNSTSQEELGEHLGKIDKASTTYNDLVDLNTKLDSITTAEGMMDFLTNNYGDSKASEPPSMVRDTAPSEVPTLTFNSLSKEKLNLLSDQINTILNQFEGEDGRISLNNKSDGTSLSEEEKTLVRKLLEIYNQLIQTAPLKWE